MPIANLQPNAVKSWTRPDGIVVDDKTGMELYTSENIALMFHYLGECRDALEDHHRAFVDDLQIFFAEQGYLSPKQFHYLRITHNEATPDRFRGTGLHRNR